MVILYRCSSCDDNDGIVHFTADNATTESFNVKEKLTDQTGNNDKKNITIWLKYLSNFRRILEMSLIVKLLLI